MTSYVRLLLSQLFVELKAEIIDCYRESEIDNDLLDKIIANPTDVGGTLYED